MCSYTSKDNDNDLGGRNITENSIVFHSYRDGLRMWFDKVVLYICTRCELVRAIKVGALVLRNLISMSS